MVELVSRAVCLLVIWPALLLMFRAPSPARPGPQAIATYRRQWGLVLPTQPRVYACRIQFAVMPV